MARGDPLGGPILAWSGRRLAARPAPPPMRRGAAPRRVRARLLRGGLPALGGDDRGDAAGLFTGYYEPLLQGARTPDAPLPRARSTAARRSRDGRPRPVRPGPRRACGSRAGSQDGELVPYYTRAEIDAGRARGGHGLELVWVDDPVAKLLPRDPGLGPGPAGDGSVVRVGYAAQNGQPYRAIGSDLVEMGALAARAGLAPVDPRLAGGPPATRDPGHRRQQPVLRFFRELPESGRRARAARRRGRGADARAARSRSTATSCRSARRSGSTPRRPATTARRPLRRLVVAQDTGGAIRGPVRGDFFWGAGGRRRVRAGPYAEPGPLLILLPRGLVPPADAR